MHNCNRQNSMVIMDIDSEVRFPEVECVSVLAQFIISVLGRQENTTRYLYKTSL